ncbi:MAG: site-2 protease family protein [Bacteroidales bacterium]|jgi:Zn-dependent protease|nr:site-2 protease family protein [Bacteroidales bacterium]
MEGIDILRTLKFLPGIVIGLTVHEFSHAWIASLCGDTTSKDQGRLTLNPLKHIDLLGFIMLLVAGFGWAKPVQFDEKNLHNPKKDIMKIAVAGPLSNALTAMVLSIIYLLFIDIDITGYHRGHVILSEIFIYAIYINWGLLVFNLIPIPPLDGSHLLLNWFRKYPALYAGLYKYGTIALFGLLIFSAISKINLLPIWPAIEFLGKGFLSLFSFL